MTTLEHLATLQAQKNKSLETFQQSEIKNRLPHTKEMKIVNPFDQGVRKNFQQVFGSNLWLILLPRPVEPAKPFQPHKSKFE